MSTQRQLSNADEHSSESLAPTRFKPALVQAPRPAARRGLARRLATWVFQRAEMVQEVGPGRLAVRESEWRQLGDRVKPAI